MPKKQTCLTKKSSLKTGYTTASFCPHVSRDRFSCGFFLLTKLREMVKYMRYINCQGQLENTREQSLSPVGLLGSYLRAFYLT